MTLKLLSMKTSGSDPGEPVGLVEISFGDALSLEQSTEWISGPSHTLDDTNVKSLALLQIAALKKLRDLLIDENDRLALLYRASERSQR